MKRFIILVLFIFIFNFVYAEDVEVKSNDIKTETVAKISKEINNDFFVKGNVEFGGMGNYFFYKENNNAFKSFTKIIEINTFTKYYFIQKFHFALNLDFYYYKINYLKYLGSLPPNMQKIIIRPVLSLGHTFFVFNKFFIDFQINYGMPFLIYSENSNNLEDTTLQPVYTESYKPVSFSNIKKYFYEKTYGTKIIFKYRVYKAILLNFVMQFFYHNSNNIEIYNKKNNFSLVYGISYLINSKIK